MNKTEFKKAVVGILRKYKPPLSDEGIEKIANEFVQRRKSMR